MGVPLIEQDNPKEQTGLVEGRKVIGKVRERRGEKF